MELKRTSPVDVWCPHGRISIQNISGGHVEAIPTGGFNMCVVDNVVYRSARCAGKECVHYRRGLNPFSWGKCKLDREPLGIWIVIAAIIVSIAPYLPWVEWFNFGG